MANQWKFKLSDHYQGKTFFNPTLVKQALPGFFSAIKMLFTTSKEIWPEERKNQHTPVLNIALKTGQSAITFVNHVTFLIQFPGLTILTDPVWSQRVSPFSWLGPKRVRKPGIDLSQLPSLDLILISHNHYDHMDIATLKQLRKKSNPTIIVPLGDKNRVTKLGFSHVIELDWWDSFRINDKTTITFLPTQHFSSRSLFDRCKSLWGSFLIQYENSSVYFGGDAGYSSHFKEIFNRMGPIDLALLGIGAYEPQWFMQSMHMNPAEAAQAYLDLQAKHAIGMHYGTFQLSAEGIDKPQVDLQLALKQKQLSAKQFITLGEGETRVFNLTD